MRVYVTHVYCLWTLFLARTLPCGLQGPEGCTEVNDTRARIFRQRDKYKSRGRIDPIIFRGRCSAAAPVIRIAVSSGERRGTRPVVFCLHVDPAATQRFNKLILPQNDVSVSSDRVRHYSDYNMQTAVAADSHLPCWSWYARATGRVHKLFLRPTAHPYRPQNYTYIYYIHA
jgi:hypothetical protein